MPLPDTAEHRRLAESEARRADWKFWGPYVSDRAWGTVREDYSADGNAWAYFPHDHARSRAYRWNEDGIGGFCDRHQRVCLALAFWNERDPYLKERFFGVTNPEGNHGEDVKEYYFYQDSTPTHSYARMMYRYPQAAYPYDGLVEESLRRDRTEPEYELLDALRGDFEAGRYFDITIEYAQAGEHDILCRIRAHNHATEAAPLHILPHCWFRNTWSWGHATHTPSLCDASDAMRGAVKLDDDHVGERWWYATGPDGPLPLLFTENVTNREKLYGTPNEMPYVKDGVHEAVVHGNAGAVNPDGVGTKVAGHFRAVVPAGEAVEVRVRFSNAPLETPWGDFDEMFVLRQREADEFYATVQRKGLNDDEKRVQRQAFGGLLWSKQFYHYNVEDWLDGDPAGPKPPRPRAGGRNASWRHLHNGSVVSMPDKWEYPWYAAWDLAFHVVPLAMVDPEWAKRQLILLMREWFMHPNGQLPAYEWSFSDVNPPVHAWAVWRVYQIAQETTGVADTDFLERAFHKLLLNFTWWINRKDADGNNVFQGGFLGLDNIGVFDRSKPLPGGGYLEQADGTAWMGLFSLNMLSIALELARVRPAYEDIATKFFEHFVGIANALSNAYGETGLWSEEDGFFYDMLMAREKREIPLQIRSFVGLIPLFAVATIDVKDLEKLPAFKRRMAWFYTHRPHLMQNLSLEDAIDKTDCMLLSLVNPKQLRRILTRVLDPAQFLSDFGLRSLSREYADEPYTFHVYDDVLEVRYEPGESSTGLFGGNSNWRGPIWLPTNYMMIRALNTFYGYFNDTFKVEMPTGSGVEMTLREVSVELARRLSKIFLEDDTHRFRPVFGADPLWQDDDRWREHLLFYEYFHGDDGYGLGASHQTGWTALVARLIHYCGGDAEGCDW